MINQNGKILFGNDNFYNKLKNYINNTKKGKGSIFFVSGETGFGKSHLLKMLYDFAMEKDSGVISCFVESSAPVGQFNVSNIQPLMPFKRIIEQLLDNKHMSPEKKLALSMTMSFLAALPGIGEFAYLYKEWKEDLKKFKGDKSNKPKDNAADEYYEGIKKYSEKYPLILLMDDMHWADAQTIALINKFLETIEDLPVMFVITYKLSEVEGKALPLYKFLSNPPENIYNVHLEVLDKSNLREACYYYFTDYKPNSEFENWIMEKSYGVPGIVLEYLNYFSEYPPFDAQGNLVTNFENNEYLPASVQSVFTQTLDKISEEEKNILGLVSAEGRQFTATIAADLMNTDILTTIKKLRTIQNKSGIIKSLGAKSRYGVKTTIYEFTQAFYQNYFENSLEYEEYTAIHGQIASLLKKRYEEADAKEIKEQIAPYLAAHSAESGDDKTAQDMLMVSAKTAKEYGASEILQHTLSIMRSYGDINENDADELKSKGFEDIYDDIAGAYGFNPSKGSGNDNGTGTSDGIKNKDNIPDPDDFSLEVDYDVMLEKVIELYFKGKYKLASEKAKAYCEKNSATISTVRKTMLYLISTKSLIEVEDYPAAENDLKKVDSFIEKSNDEEMKCFMLNVYALLRFKQNEFKKSMNYLNKAAQLSFKIAPELRLLTLSNIAQISKKTSPDLADKYFEAARELSKELDFKEFSNQLFEIY